MSSPSQRFYGAQSYDLDAPAPLPLGFKEGDLARLAGSVHRQRLHRGPQAPTADQPAGAEGFHYVIQGDALQAKHRYQIAGDVTIEGNMPPDVHLDVAGHVDLRGHMGARGIIDAKLPEATGPDGRSAGLLYPQDQRPAVRISGHVPQTASVFSNAGAQIRSAHPEALLAVTGPSSHPLAVQRRAELAYDYGRPEPTAPRKPQG